MLFSSWIFIATFLPVTWAVYYVLQRRTNRETALSWLIAASLFFYGWFRADYVLIILLSALFNFSLGTLLRKRTMRKVNKNRLLGFGVTANLLALGYYKYAGFFMDTLNATTRAGFTVPQIVLPLAISFFTFQQVAYLVDARKAETEESNFRHYLLFVTFFPQLIAGPIVHHKEMIPQFMKRGAAKIDWNMVATGVTVFILGLFKKVVIADHMGEIADPIFLSASEGAALTFFEAWLGAVAYALQIYFDFSGYSDMAIGLGAMFGIKLPLNFYAPYKARNIVEFWRRWHITLSRFLKDYLYIPLGGNRKGTARRYVNLGLTMLLGGLWHGANWTFVIWGGLHGMFLCVVHAWEKTGVVMPRVLAQTITLLAVIVAWVFFRADSADTAFHVLSCMANENGMALRDTGSILAQGLEFFGLHVAPTESKLLQISDKWYIFWVTALTALFAPTVYQFAARDLAMDTTNVAADAKTPRLTWSPSLRWSVPVAVMGTLALFFLTRVNAFIYFQF